jgi:orotidine 5'-phosphate decarboxylase subfamily 2
MSEQPSSLEKLRRRVAEVGVPLCLGIDPHPDALPENLPRTVEGVERFARGLLSAAGDLAAAVKVNVAFFEAYGSAGWGALERLVADLDAEQFLILDAKRGDIRTTAERQAEALMGRLRADAVTVSPYLGEDAIEPFLAHPGRMVFVLAHTSNPSAGTFQDLPVDGKPLDEHIARWVVDRWPDGRAGLVVGAVDPSVLARLRAAAPGPSFLVPGIGAQGGDLDGAIRSCHGSLAPGLVTISRAIATASGGSDWQAAARSAAQAWIGRMREAGATLSV